MTPDERRRPKRPKTKARLEQLITQWQKDSGVPVARLNLRIAAMMLAGALARIVDAEGEALFATKGGIAMELWMGGRARATRDIDLVLRGHPGQLAERLDAALREPYNGFRFRRGEIDDLPARPSVKKVRIQISFGGRVLSSAQLEIAPLDTGDEEFVALPAAKLDPVGLDGPDVVLVLDARWQIAQKLHAVTEQPDDGRVNPRFRDLLDLQLLEALDPDLSADPCPATGCEPCRDASCASCGHRGGGHALSTHEVERSQGMRLAYGGLDSSSAMGRRVRSSGGGRRPARRR
jgi:Nucleotidyl transferase AbiEii toxin, Type IV TA system